DPTEIAILRAAARQGIDRATIEKERPRRAVHAFDADRRRMSILREDGRLYVKGALEALIPHLAMSIEGVEAAAEDMARRGLRVLAVAVGEGPEEENLALLGLVGIADTPRPEARRAIELAQRAGIKVVMITGDHPATAEAIATEMG